MPTFTKLEDPLPLPFSRGTEREVPLKMEEASEEASEAKEKGDLFSLEKSINHQKKMSPSKSKNTCIV